MTLASIMREPEAYLTTKDVADRLHRSPDRVRQLGRAGEIVAAIVTRHGQRLYTEAEVLRYQKRQSLKPER